MSERAPINDEKLEECFLNISTKRSIGLAISGGPDSMALLLLVDRWRCARVKADKPIPDLRIFSVDHGLRAEAAHECAFVMRQAKALGYEGETLTWEGEVPKSRVQESAREIRYQLLAAACHKHGIKSLLTAHHIDDQAETFLMRLARGSGVDGLCAMAKESRRYGLHLHRPLLDLEKTVLLQELQEANWDYIEDPSNSDPRFERVRIRQHSKDLEALGLTSKMISLGARRLRRAKMALNEISDRFLDENAFISEYGTARIDQLALYDAPDEIAIRALSRVLRMCGGTQDVPNMARLETLLDGLNGDFSTNRTLAGCRLIAKGDFWLVVREVGRIIELQKPLVPGGCMFWDARYIVCADQKASKNIVAGPLISADELIGSDEEKALQAIEKEAVPSLLALRNKGELVAVPAIDFWQSESIRAGLQAKFITGDDILV